MAGKWYTVKSEIRISKSETNSKNIEIGKQLFRSAGSIGANYIEASESLGKKDFAILMNIFASSFVFRIFYSLLGTHYLQWLISVAGPSANIGV